MENFILWDLTLAVESDNNPRQILLTSIVYPSEADKIFHMEFLCVWLNLDISHGISLYLTKFR